MGLAGVIRGTLKPHTVNSNLVSHTQPCTGAQPWALLQLKLWVHHLGMHLEGAELQDVRYSCMTWRRGEVGRLDKEGNPSSREPPRHGPLSVHACPLMIAELQDILKKCVTSGIILQESVL